MKEPRACADCLRRSWLLSRLAGHIDVYRARLEPLLALDDQQLVAAVGGRQREAITREHGAFDPAQARAAARRAGLEQRCRCDPGYPRALLELAAPPAVLHIVGTVGDQPAVAIVGARQPSSYGSEVARSLARGLAAAGVVVISGLARGIDSWAHRGALDVDGVSVGVLAGAAEIAYPPRARTLHSRLQRTGAVISELPPGTRPRRWMFPARNRLIAALSAVTVVVEARAASGALITAEHASRLGRGLGAVPGRVSSPLAAGPHRLLREGAQLIEGPEDVLVALFGAEAPPARPQAGQRRLDPGAQVVLDALAEGADTEAALRRAGLGTQEGLAVLAGLELGGHLARGAGGGYSVRSQQ